jgi:SAM-dependent methyltransferase
MGAEVVAVEPDAGFAGYLGRTLPAVRVLRAPFEEAVTGDGFDAVVAATSFHWLDQATALPALGRALRPGGWAAIWWSVFSDPYREDPLLRAASAKLGFEPGNQRGGTSFQLDTGARCDDLRRGAGLVDVDVELIPWDLPMTADQVRALFNSMIAVRRLPDERRHPPAPDRVVRRAAARLTADAPGRTPGRPGGATNRRTSLAVGPGGH